MWKKYLKVGDVIFLQKGTVVAVPDLPLVIGNHSVSAFTEKLGDIWVKVGVEQVSRTDVTQERLILRDRIIAAFTDLEIPLDHSIMDRFIAHQVKKREEKKIYIPSCNFIVVETSNARGIHHVFCRQFYSEDEQRIYFWQGDGERLSPLVHNDIRPVRSWP